MNPYEDYQNDARELLKGLEEGNQTALKQLLQWKIRRDAGLPIPEQLLEFIDSVVDKQLKVQRKARTGKDKSHRVTLVELITQCSSFGGRRQLARSKGVSDDTLRKQISACKKRYNIG